MHAAPALANCADSEARMGYAYTPGLTVADATVVRKVRRLPLQGHVRVVVGQSVAAEDVVAETSLPGEVRPVNAVAKLGIAPEELSKVMLKGAGDTLAAQEVFARTKGLFGLFRSEAESPINGTIESISTVTGQVIIRGQPTALRKLAYARGQVVAVQPDESATIEVRGTYIQGIFGIGGEVTGQLAVAVENPDAVLDAARIQPEFAGKIIVGGSLVTADAVQAAIRIGVRGIISGGLNDSDLRNFLGYELGVAITGEETLGITLMITEGFGPISMARATFDLLRKRAGLLASMNGATQIRAGVIRPELIIPLAEGTAGNAEQAAEASVLAIGTPLRAIREPYFGWIGRCAALPAELARLPSETRVRVLEVEFDNGQRAIVPRANVELIKH
jgi:hypothetical protein